MAGASINITINDQVSPMLRSFLNMTNDFSQPLAAAGLYMYRETANQFRSEGAYQGTPWAPLSAATIKRRREGKNKGAGIKILQDTRELLASITSDGAPDAVYELSRFRLRFGTNKEYALIHQQGGDITINRVVKAGSVRLRRTKNNQVRFANKRHKKVWNVAYAGGKQFTQNIHIPARPFLVFTDKNNRYISREIFLRYAMKGFK